MFAVIELQWHQYIVRQDDTIVVDKLELEGATYTTDKVLLIADEEGTSVTLGAPYVANTQVNFDVVTDFQKGEKIRVLKFKRKNRYQRIIGFRPHQTVLQVTSIGGESKKTKKAEAVTEIAEPVKKVGKTEKITKAETSKAKAPAKTEKKTATKAPKVATPKKVTKKTETTDA